MDHIISNIKELENSVVFNDGVNEIVKHKIKKQGDWVLGLLLGTLGA